MEKESKKIRLNLAIPNEVNEQLEELRAASGASSITEVLRRSIALFHMVTDHVKGGGSIVLRSADKKSEEVVRLL